MLKNKQLMHLIFLSHVIKCSMIMQACEMKELYSNYHYSMSIADKEQI